MVHEMYIFHGKVYIIEWGHISNSQSYRKEIFPIGASFAKDRSLLVDLWILCSGIRSSRFSQFPLCKIQSLTGCAYCLHPCYASKSTVVGSQIVCKAGLVLESYKE